MTDQLRANAPRPGLGYVLRKKLRALVQPFPWAYRFLLRLWGIVVAVRFFGHALTSGKLRTKRDDGRFAAFLSHQSVLRFDVNLGIIRDADDLRQALAARELDPVAGGWTLYVGPGPAFDECFPFLRDVYPPGVGLKILKDLQHPDDAIYARHALNPAAGASLLRKLTPPPKALMRIANQLHAAGLGPRVHDLIHLDAAGVPLTAYVVDHVGGPLADARAHAQFMPRLQAWLEGGAITTVHSSTDAAMDFEPPDCNGNLRLDAQTGRPLYVDFQSFMITDDAALVGQIAEEEKGKTHFGGTRFFRGGGRYLYQAIPGLAPGKRDIETRWRAFDELLRHADLSLDGRLVFDIGCNTGLMLYQALGAGALWGYGWDMPEVAGAASRLLPALGATRATITGGAIDDATDFAAVLPDRFADHRDGVLFYLAVSDHIGFPPGVADLPWTHMFYEGHADQGVGDQYQRIKAVPWLAGAELLGHRMITDGDSPARPLMLLRRPS